MSISRSLVLEDARVDRESPCLICGDPVGPAPVRCPRCDTPHHFDCWEYSQGCGVYGCSHAARPREERPEAQAGLPAKLGLPHKRAGAYAGHLWVPPVETILLFLIEAVAVPLCYYGHWLEGGITLAMMAAVVLWIALSSVHYYVDFERLKISKAKALLGRDIWEWDIADLGSIRYLSLTPLPQQRGFGDQEVYQVQAVSREADREELALTPPLPVGSEGLREALDLLRRIQASQAFSVHLPLALLTGEGPRAEIPDRPDPGVA